MFFVFRRPFYDCVVAGFGTDEPADNLPGRLLPVLFEKREHIELTCNGVGWVKECFQSGVPLIGGAVSGEIV